MITNEEIRKCGKDGVCCWCGEPIKKGDIIHTWTDLSDRVSYIKMHPECYKKGWKHCDGEEWFFYDQKRGTNICLSEEQF